MKDDGSHIATNPRTRLVLTASSNAKLARHVRLKHDTVHQKWILLAPEKILSPNDTALEALQLCDGIRTIRNIADELANSYEASSDDILADILPLLQELADQGHLVA